MLSFEGNSVLSDDPDAVKLVDGNHRDRTTVDDDITFKFLSAGVNGSAFYREDIGIKQ